jgi:amino acid adenylation domain-containing protein
VKESVAAVQAEKLIAYVVTETPDGCGSAELRQFLSTRLPDFMLPMGWVFLTELPRLPNGKINRSALPQPDSSFVHVDAHVPPATPLEQAIAAIWQTELQLESVGRNDNFFELGGHSLLGMSVIARINEKLGVELPLRTLFQSPTVAGLAAQIAADASAVAPDSQRLPTLTPAPDQRYQPFPLTDIQQAYWIGRNEAFELGNVSTHGYREIEVTGLTVTQVEQAVQRLIDRHEMLRVIVQPDGQQRILSEVPPYKITRLDLRHFSAEQTALQLNEVRNRLSHQILPTDSYPLFDIQAVLLDSNKIRFCVSFDVLIGDAWSFQQLGQELAQLLQNPNLELPPLSLSFRDYVLAERSWRHSVAYQRSVDYWQRRLPALPPAPDLPLAQSPSAISDPHFTRRSGKLDASLWQALKQQASQYQLTPSGLLLAVFAEILAFWSRSPQFTLNLTLFNRLPLHPEVNQIVGDFTSSMLLAIDCSSQDAFTLRAQQIQAQLWQDLDHRYVSGVEVLRQLARRQQQTTQALMPVVFTSILSPTGNSSSRSSTDLPSNVNWRSEVVYSLSQTSQVYLDHQVAEVNEALIFNWDTIDDLFPSGLLDQMFAAYTHLLEQLANDPTCWNSQPLLIPFTNLSTPESTETFPQSDRLLHDLFLDRVTLHPDHLALIAPQHRFTYQELADRAHQLAYYLHQQGVSAQNVVAVVMEKGWEQVVAVLGILMAGAVYIPIDPDLPAERRADLLQQTEARYILTQSWLDTTLTWTSSISRLSLDQLLLHPSTVWASGESAEPLVSTAMLDGDGQNRIPQSSATPTDLAYIIYTSGSTGRPKGVMIDHQGAVNTILDINHRFQVGISDRILALSSLSFDLSVYDIFGSLAAGSTLVLPDAKLVKDPSHWAVLIREHQITIWNSVPALMSLLLQSLDSAASLPFRLVLLSGDWIPLSLPDRIRQCCDDTTVVSLGGATEASIWSIFYPITEVHPTWNSIPYGRPLSNQQVYVLNHALNPCPTWVTGQLYIGGKGLAKGYWRDPDRTNASFIIHPELGRLYRTGDLGRYLPDGEIEFLGREDFQVKLNGYRIELGEIEAALQQHPAIQAAVVISMNQRLVAYVVPKVERIEFKLQQQHRQLKSNNQISLPVSETISESSYLRRQSYRHFLSSQISLTQLSQFLSALQQFQIKGSPLPKYRYASAGSLYPVQTYILVKPGYITDIEAGIYHYDSRNHSLALISSLPEVPQSVYGSNHKIFEQAAFSLFLIGELEAITPLYGDKARDFCLLEAGYMGQLLMQTAPDHDLGLCPIGTLELAEIAAAFQLEASHILLHSFVGGAIDPVWTTQWNGQASAPQKPDPSLLEKLQESLRQKLPVYMVPHTFVFLESLPLNTNGKIDRQSLPQPTLSTDANQIVVAPRTEVEQAIAAIWQQALQVETVGVYANFFDLGGNSLSATQVLTQMRQTFQIDLSIRQFFTAATIAKQAEVVQAQIEANSALPSQRMINDLPIQKLDRGQRIAEQVEQLSDQDVEAMLQQMLTTESLEIESPEVES